MSWSEDRMHRWILKLRERSGEGSIVLGSRGHDAAVLRARPGRPVLCIDQTIESVHFHPRTSAAQVGRKAVGRALSDLAATAAKPRAILLSISAPAHTDESWLRGAVTAALREAQEFGAELVGGDLACAAGPVLVTVSAFGTQHPHGRSPGRDRAREGQVVILTGPVGGSALGRHLAIEPRIEAGQALYELGATALMDVSDGLALDLWRMARASRVRIELARVPIHTDARKIAQKSGRSALDHALHDGEDHELLATVPARRVGRLTEARWAEGLEPCIIGRVHAGSGLRVPTSENGAATRRWRREGGWLHGQR